jgi:hypothetical protein
MVGRIVNDERYRVVRESCYVQVAFEGEWEIVR